MFAGINHTLVKQVMLCLQPTTTINTSIVAKNYCKVENLKKGYQGEPAPKLGEGILFIFYQPQKLSFWMKNVDFPLGLVYLDSDRVVVGKHLLKPQDLTPIDSPDNVQYALEVSPEQLGALQLGAQLDF